jgi:hypothetical protein
VPALSACKRVALVKEEQVKYYGLAPGGFEITAGVYTDRLLLTANPGHGSRAGITLLTHS